MFLSKFFIGETLGAKVPRVEITGEINEARSFDGGLGASLRGDAIVTSDPDDIVRLVADSGVQLSIISV